MRAEETIGEETEETKPLNAPQNFRYENGYFKWDKVEEAYGYCLRMQIYENSYQEFTKYFDYDDPADEAQIELDRLCYEYNIDFGEYTFEVCIFDQEWNRSEWSETITAEYAPTLDAPTNVRLSEENNGELVWDEVDGAVRYNIRIYLNDSEHTMYTTNCVTWNSVTYKYMLGEPGDYWISVQAMDKDYNVSEWTEPILVSQVRLDTAKNIRLDESGENILWDEVDGVDYYEILLSSNVIADDNKNERATRWINTEEAQITNWKSYAYPSVNGEYYVWVVAHSSKFAPSYSEEITVSYSPVKDELLELPENLQLKDNSLQWIAADNAKTYWMFVYAKGERTVFLYNQWSIDDFNWNQEGYSKELSHYLGNQFVEGAYDIELTVVDENNNYNSKIYSVDFDATHDETVWIPEMYYKFDTLLWDYDRLRHEDTSCFWIRITDTRDDTVVKLAKTPWSEFHGLLDLPNGNYAVEICVYEWTDKLGSWSEPLKITVFDGNYFDEQNESTEEIVVPPEIEETIPEEDRVTSITINPAFNMKHKDGDDVELDISKITIKAEEIYDEEGLKRVEEALGHEIKPNQKYNLLDLTLLYDGEDFSNGYEGLVQVIIPIPSGHRDKTFTVYRLTEVDGQIVKEIIPGEQTEDSYIIYLEHFSEYALVGEGEHIHEFSEEWTTDETNHWKECECGEKSEEAAHTYGEWKVTKAATETAEGEKERVCEICQYKQTEAIEKLSHSFGDDWKYDETNHWKECESCGEESEKAKHTYGDWTVTKEATETDEGSQERSCEICGYKQTETLPKLAPTTPIETEKPTETEKPADPNPDTGVGAINVSILVLSACGAAIAFAAKRRKSK